MKIAIISDTHGNIANFRKMVNWLNNLPDLPAQAGENIKLIFHAGDIGGPESLKESLEEFKGEFFGVFGNMDKDYKILIDEYNKIPGVKIEEDTFETEIDGKKIAINHFPGEAKKLAQSGKYDLVFYGHTHRACLARHSGVPLGSEGGGRKRKECLLVNPGELAGQFYKPTFAVYDTETEKLELKILEKII